MKHISVFLIAAMAIFLACLLVLPAMAQKSARVLILPFNINAKQEYSYLQEGIYDMLVSRLAAVPEAQIIERGTVEQTLQDQPGQITAGTAVALGESLQADYIIYGSFTLFGESISTDAHLFDTGQQRIVVSFNQTGQTHGDLIGHINRFSDQIKAAAFGIAIAAAPPPPTPPPPTSAAPASPQAGGAAPQTGASGLESGLSPEPVAATPFAIVKSRRFKTEIVGLTVADVNGDKVSDLVFIDKDNIYVYRYEEERFKKTNEIEAGRSHQLLSVDAADINANGNFEIFVTSAVPGTFDLNSFVMEREANAFIKTIDNASWYFRVTAAADRNALLLGQQRGKRAVFLATKYELELNNGKIAPATVMSLPNNLNIFGLAFGKIFQKEESVTVAFAANDSLLILGNDGDQIWSSGTPLGGSSTYLEAEDPDGDRMGEYRIMKRVYFPQRILVSDLDRDGTDEIVVVNNKSTAGRLFEKTRNFKGGAIECLAWNGSDMITKWKTRDFNDYISDYAIGDLDNDGTLELVFAVVDKRGTLGRDVRSSVYMMELQ